MRNNRRAGFTLIELLVVIAIIALLMAILMPSLQRVKKQAQATACQGQLRQWGIIFAMYTSENDGKFHNRPYGTQYEKMWPTLFEPYYSDPMMRCCPAAKNPNNQLGPFGTWGWAKSGAADTEWGWGGTWTPEKGLYGSYAMSRYMLNRPTEEAYWRQADVRGADDIPVFLDCMYVAIDPAPTDDPPQYDGERSNTNRMQWSCINRHVGHVNSLFLDWSAKKVGLKELWTLRWSRTFDITGPWTKAGGAQPGDWPQWMRGLKDY